MAEKLDRCWACMELVNGQTLCPHCHFDMSRYQANPRCLQPGANLGNRYIVGKVLGEGGFGITYIGWDTRLDMPVAIKEYFPSGMASRDTTNSISDRINVFEGKTEKSYQEGLQRFLREAKNLSKFHDSHGIVSVHDFFHENETAYLIMEYIPGMSLKEYISGDEERGIAGHGRMRPEEVFQIMKPVMRSLEKIHRSGMIHRDISPDNIMITPEGEIKLIDFGAMRTSNDGDNKSLTIVLKRGFAPEEQYRSKGQQGPWTDVYAISATIYYMLTGKVPPEATERYMEDPILSFAEEGVILTKRENDAVMKGLAVQRQQRYQTIQEMFRELYGDIPISQTMEEPVAPSVMHVTEGQTEREAVRSAEREVPRSVEREVPRSMEREVPRSAGREVPRSAEREVSHSAEREVPRSAGREAPRAAEREVPRSMEREVPPSAERGVPRPAVGETILMTEDRMEQFPETVLSEEMPEAKILPDERVLPKAKALQPPHSVSAPKRSAKEPEHSRKSPLPVVLGIAGLIVVVAIAVVAFLTTGQDGKAPERQKEASVPVTASPAAELPQETEEVTEEPVLTFEMVDVVNQKKAAAENAVKEMGDEQLGVKYTSKYSETVQKGYVIRQSISAGTVYRQGEETELTLVISKGKQRVTVPNVVGKTREQAIALIHERGLKYEITAYPNSSVYDKGDVMKQSPAPGKKVKKKSTVRIRISDGPKAASSYSSGSTGGGSGGSSSGSSTSGSSGGNSGSGSDSGGSSSSGSKSKPDPIANDTKKPSPIG